MDWALYWFYLERIASHYFFVAGMAFLMLYIVLQSKFVARKIQKNFPEKSDYMREIGYSVCTMLIFAAVPLFIVENPLIEPYTTYYRDVTEHGWLYFFLAFPLMFLIHDTYFYWTHRLMHKKSLFEFFHAIHHRSSNPSPWTAYSMHPWEALVQAGNFVVFLTVLPVHPLHLSIFFFLMIIYDVYGHLGYELYPKGFAKHWLGKWVNTSVGHNYHHRYFQGNYSFYFLFWDRLMGTLKKT